MICICFCPAGNFILFITNQHIMKNICVLISGSGSTLAALISACRNGIIPAQINRVIADRDCPGKQHAFAAALPFTMIDRRLTKAQFNAALTAAIPTDSALIVLAGFLSIIPPALTTAFANKIINLHPSLLPKFGGAGMYGSKVHQAVLAAGETESGCSVHYVDNGIDTGAVIAQARVAVFPDDTPATLQQRVQAEEQRLLPAVIARLLQNSPFPPPAG